ncbi:hypothetical protein lerEdw1_008177 [Lerista edwardsae]|nr:hypothetical protein lerEdw1_008177 [Lerista edwardsae]
MGVPKFYRWVSERYPCLSQVLKEQQIPEFDNLYLDMNGIIHQCSHPNDDDVHFRISEDKIFADIFHYLEVLFRIIKPRKVFFMAVDGVAPRAKMNQQRGRRFRVCTPEETTFHLLHLSLMREYIDYEFSPVKFDREHFSEIFVDLKWFESKVGNKYLNEAAGIAAEESKKQKKHKAQENAICLAALEKTDNGIVVTSKSTLEDEPEDDDLFETEFRQYKRTYYMTKMGVEVVSDDFLADQAECYVQAIQWILHYYYHGVQSWSW